MIQRMLAIWSLFPLPFLNPACTSESSQFTYCWSLAWRILSITLLACEVRALVRWHVYVLWAVLRCFRHVWLFVTQWTVAHKVPLYLGFSRQEYWSGLLSPSPGDVPDSGIEPASLTSPALVGGSLPLPPPLLQNHVSRFLKL